MEIVNRIVDFLMILIWLAPLIVAFGKLIAQKTNNQKLTNLMKQRRMKKKYKLVILRIPAYWLARC